ncbi:McrB family protein [Pectobacterium carotovorum]|uniref:McrB family protein n=1 Tax=Pectobacterium carotovorum TaxID=554 RepID=UPI00050841E2|nr:AAA family ATPase [Pectobacterium carotovorum]KFX02052.1 restriction endonuclease [Pectobacterium carotovorum subsp. carotovorum]KML71919.1 restriction endonuclease [Pectobacterium carotovorum subsp. carotovorum ICMP 5702]MBA0175409.1 AAA family ATPase [Pectobacterium carotovorum]SHG34870.1 5-methylcytosine-specific restriction enzyme B [Pectobacterium carotovorum]
MDIIAQVEKGQWSLDAFIKHLVKYSQEKYPKWENNYHDLVVDVKEASSFSTPATDDLLKRLWYVRDNGIANIRQGGFSLAEFERNLPFFRAVTEQIRQQKNEGTYWKITQEMEAAKEDGRLSRMYFALRNRVFAAFAPDICTTTVDYKAFTKTMVFLNTHFKLKLSVNDNRSWLQLNHDLKKALSSLLQINDFKVNMAVWGLCELLNQRQKTQEQVDSTSIRDAVSHKSNEVVMPSPFNQIFFGPPGTGKTYTLQQKMAEYTTQATPEDYDVWLDSRLAPLNWMQIVALVLLDVKKATRVPQIIIHRWFRRKALLNGRDSHLSQTAWTALQEFAVASSETVKYSNRREPAVFDKTTGSEWFLVESQLEQIEDLVTFYDGLKRGPEQGEKIQRFSTVTFHQSYGYEEFIQGIRARSDGNGNVSYSTEQGIFLQLCDRAKADPEHRYAIFIDEINRGNISKIFGELIALIETDKRAGMKNALSLQLAYSESGDLFSVPANVDIIGAMNTADRSLALMDTALRRRFEFIEMMPDLSLLSGVKVKGIELESLLEKLNSRIEALYDREHTLGHAFFIPVKTAQEEKGEESAFKVLQAVFKKKVIPLLQEYFFDDWNKIRLVLADNQKKNDSLQFIIEKVDELDELFGDDHGLRRHNQKSTAYELKDFELGVWSEPSAYRAIYEPKVDYISDSDERNG